MQPRNFSEQGQNYVECQLNVEYNEQVERNRHVINKAKTEALVTCGQPNVAIHCQTDETSNFQTFLNFQAKLDPICQSI